MLISNLRFIWYLDKNTKINLSVGYDCITRVDIKNNYSSENGQMFILTLRAKKENSKFEFIFKTLKLQKTKDIFSTF